MSGMLPVKFGTQNTEVKPDAEWQEHCIFLVSFALFCRFTCLPCFLRNKFSSVLQTFDCVLACEIKFVQSFILHEERFRGYFYVLRLFGWPCFLLYQNRTGMKQVAYHLKVNCYVRYMIPSKNFSPKLHIFNTAKLFSSSMLQSMTPAIFVRLHIIKKT